MNFRYFLKIISIFIVIINEMFKKIRKMELENTEMGVEKYGIYGKYGRCRPINHGRHGSI